MNCVRLVLQRRAGRSPSGRRRSSRRRIWRTGCRRATSSCCSKTEENSRAIGRPELSGKAFKIGFYDMAFLQILWTQNETRLMPNPLTQFPDGDRGGDGRARASSSSPRRWRRAAPAAPSCHHNGNKQHERRGRRHVPGLQHPRAGRHQPRPRSTTRVRSLRLGERLLLQAVRPAAGPRRPAEHQQPEHEAPAVVLGQRAALAAPRRRAHACAKSCWRPTRRCCSRASAASTSAPCAPITAASWRSTSSAVRESVLPTEVPITFADSRDDGSCTQLAATARGRSASAWTARSCAGPGGPGLRRGGVSGGRAADRSARHEQRRAADRRRPDQPGAGGQSHPGDQGHARQDVTTVGGATSRRCRCTSSHCRNRGGAWGGPRSNDAAHPDSRNGSARRCGRCIRLAFADTFRRE